MKSAVSSCVLINWNNDSAALYPSSFSLLEDFRFYLKTEAPLDVKINVYEAVINPGLKLEIAQPAEKQSLRMGMVQAGDQLDLKQSLIHLEKGVVYSSLRGGMAQEVLSSLYLRSLFSSLLTIGFHSAELQLSHLYGSKVKCPSQKEEDFLLGL